MMFSEISIAYIKLLVYRKMIWFFLIFRFQPKQFSVFSVPLAQLTLDAALALKLSDFVDNESLFMCDVFDLKKRLVE